jgi:hypothetical protein
MLSIVLRYFILLMHLLRWLLLIPGCAALVAGCNSILGLSDYSVSADAGSSAHPDSGSNCSWDANSGACYPCKPSTDPEFLNACTESTCVPFDDTVRVKNLPADGGLPEVPDLPPVEDAAAEGGSG